MSHQLTVKEMLTELFADNDGHSIEVQYNWAAIKDANNAVKKFQSNPKHYQSVKHATQLMGLVLWMESITEDGTWTELMSIRLREMERRFNTAMKKSNHYLKVKDMSGHQMGRRTESLDDYRQHLASLESIEYPLSLAIA